MTKFQTNPTTQNKLNTMQIIERRTQQFLLIRACLREGGGPQISEVSCSG